MDIRGTIAFVSLEIYPTTAGGVGILVHHTIRFLLSAGYEIVLLLDIEPHEFDRFAQVDRMEFENGGNLHVYNVRDLCADAVLPTVAIPHGEMLRSAKISMALEQLCERHDIELVEFYDYCGPAYYFLGTSLPNPPSIAIRLHNTIELIARKIRSARDPERLIHFSAERMSLAGADLVLSSGQKFYDWEIAPLYHEINAARVHMSPPIHAPIGEISYSPLAKNVVFYGRLSTFKGLDRFIKGAVLALQSQEFSDWLGKFVILGPEETVASAYSLDEMKDFIPPEFQHRFEFVGRVNHDALMRHLEDVAFACFANRMESFCYAAHELHTAGVPLILSDTATFRDHFQEGETGLFFDCTARGLSERMIELSQDRALRMRLSAAGKARVTSYLEDHYDRHLSAARQCRVQQTPQAIDPVVLILSNGDQRAVDKTIKSLASFEDAPKYLIMRLDDGGRFRFAGQTWKISHPGGESVNHALMVAPDAVMMVRAGDRVSEGWLNRAACLMARRSDVGAVSGWLRRRDQILMGSTGLLPEGGSHFEPGLRCLIRLNPRDTLQDALMSRPDECEGSILLALRAQNRLLLTLTEVSCNIDEAIEVPAPSVARLLDYDFDRISRDYMADLLSRSDVIQDAKSGLSQIFIERSLREPGFFCLRAVPHQSANDEDKGGREVLFLRYFSDREEQVAPWSMLQLDGAWTVRNEVGGPVEGALRTESGMASGYVRTGGAADVLVSPWAGQIEVIFQGQLKLIDLQREHVTSLRIIFDPAGIRSRPVIARSSVSGKVEAGLSLSHVPDLFAQTGRCDSIILCHAHDDLRHWPAKEILEPRVVVADADLFQADDNSESSRLAVLLEKSGAKRLVFSSKLPVTPQIGRVLRSLPKDLELGLMLCGVPDSKEEGQTLLAYFAQWYAQLEPYTDRLSCIGWPQGMIDFLRAKGANTVLLPSIRPMQPKAAAETRSPDAPVSLALLYSDQPPRNLMHMFNAALIASARGLKIDKIYIPQSYKDDLIMLDHFHLDVSLEFFTDSASLAFVGEGGKRIAFCSYPQDYFPPQLAEAAALGWLPLAGSVSEFLMAPAELQEALSEPYWENAALLADKLFGIEQNYEALMRQYLDFAKAQYDAAGDALQQYFAHTDDISNAGDTGQ